MNLCATGVWRIAKVRIQAYLQGAVTDHIASSTITVYSYRVKQPSLQPQHQAPHRVTTSSPDFKDFSLTRTEYEPMTSKSSSQTAGGFTNSND